MLNQKIINIFKYIVKFEKNNEVFGVITKEG